MFKHKSVLFCCSHIQLIAASTFIMVSYYKQKHLASIHKS